MPVVVEQVAQKTDRSHNLALGGAVGLLAAGAGVVYVLTRPKEIPTQQVPVPGQNPLTVSWAQHPARLIPSADGHLPDLVLSIENPNSQAVQVRVSVASSDGTIHFSADNRPGQGLPAGVTLATGPQVPKQVASATIGANAGLLLPWTALWERATGGGPFTAIATVEVNGVATTYPDSQTFTVTTTPAAATPAALQWSFSGGPDGAYNDGADQIMTHIGGPITAVATNTGQQPYVGTLSMIVAIGTTGDTQAPGGLRFFDASTGLATRQVNIPPGGADTSQWVTNWTFEPTSDGTYHAVGVSNP